MEIPESILLVSSHQDPAGTHIHDAICQQLKHHSDISGRYHHHRTKERLINWFYDPNAFIQQNPDIILFLSRHASKNPKPLLTVHVTGNYCKADLGGKPGCLTIAHPSMMHAILKNLFLYAPTGYGVSYEVTHHGPTGLSLPSFFVEIGSTQDEWNDIAAANAVARAVLDAQPISVIPMIGFGGTHYAIRQTELALQSRAAFGHIVPSRQIGDINKDMVITMAEMTNAAAAYIDKKSLSRIEIERIKSILSDLSLPLLGQSDLISMQDIPLEQYIRIISVAEKEVPGSRVRIQSLVTCHNPVVVCISEELLSEAEKSDSDSLIAAIGAMPVATIRKGGKNLLPVFISEEKNSRQVRHDLIHLCISIILKNSEASVNGDILTIRRVRFDPKKAQEYGIPPGSLYSTLMSGESIIHEGRCIFPNMVMTTTITSIAIPVENDV